MTPTLPPYPPPSELEEQAQAEAERQRALPNSTSARLNNTLMNVCVGFLLGGLVGILFAGLFFRWGWLGVLGGGLGWLAASVIVLAYAVANAPEM